MTERAPLRKGGVNGKERAVRSAVQLTNTESAAIRGAAEEMRAEGMPPDLGQKRVQIRPREP